MQSQLLTLLLFIVVVRSLRVGSFYVSDLVDKVKDDKSKAIAQVLRRYDVVLLSGFTNRKSINNQIVDKLKEDLEPSMDTSLVEEKWKVLPSPSQRVAFFYRREKLTCEENFHQPDTELLNVPFGALFSSNTTGDLEKFALLGLVADKWNVVNELNYLEDIFQVVQEEWKIKDIMALGNLYADCQYLNESELAGLALKNQSYKWLIADDVDTLVSDDDDCAYDRIIATGDLMREAVALETARVYKFDEAEDFDNSFDDISDHYPVEVELKAVVATTTPPSTTKVQSTSATTQKTTSSTGMPPTTKMNSAAFIKGSQAMMAMVLVYLMM